MIIDRAGNRNVLLLKEVYMIINNRPSLNYGLKASKKLQPFQMPF